MTQNDNIPQNVLGEAEPFAEVKPSVMRRLFGLAVLYTLGGLTLYIALTTPATDLLWQAFLIIFGLTVLYLGERMRRATLSSVVLTAEGLFSSDGSILVAIDNVKSIDRGVFAFKQSNGFSVVMHKKQPRAWAPGLWWRLGRRVGIGGVVQASQTKSMAEILAMMVHERSNLDDNET